MCVKVNECAYEYFECAWPSAYSEGTAGGFCSPIFCSGSWLLPSGSSLHKCGPIVMAGEFFNSASGREYVLSITGLYVWGGVGRVVWLILATWFSLVDMYALFWSVSLGDDEVRGSKVSPAVSLHLGACWTERGFLVGMVNRLQHGTARRVPHYPEVRARWVRSEVLALRGQDAGPSLFG